MRISKEQYSIVAARRTNTDTMMWQTPALSLTAQAFLLTIALSPQSSTFSITLSTCLALLVSIASIQLLMKHRHHEIHDSRLLEEFEDDEPGYLKIHGARAERSTNPLTKLSSYKVWLCLLSAFALAATTIMANALWKYYIVCAAT